VIRICVILFLSNICYYKLIAQGLINDGSNIVISTGAYVYIDGSNGDYKNQSNGANHGQIDIDGTIIVEGDWTNNATSGNVFVNRDGDGVVNFKSGTAQAINGTATTIFEDLTIENSLVGSAVTLNIDAEVSDDLTLTAGIVTTGASKVIHSSTTAADLITYSNTAFVNGNYRRHITSNASSYTFPVGDGAATTNYKRVVFVNNSLDLTGATDYLDVSVGSVTESAPENDATFAGASVTCDGTTLKEIHSGAEWTITPSNTVTSGTYGVHLFLENVGDGLTDGTLDNKFTVVKRATGSTSYANFDPIACTKGTHIPNENVAGRTWAGGYAEKLGFSSFSKFGIASGSFVLPIELLEFNSSCLDDELTIYWTTGSETNVDKFILEFSNNGRDFYFLDEVIAVGNSGVINRYDYEALKSNNYFRLIEVDLDGAKTLVGSTITSENCDKGNTYVDVIRTNNDKLTFNIGLDIDEKLDLQLFDVSGRVVHSNIILGRKGTNISSININNFANGIYMITVTGETTFFGEKVYLGN
jgi:hypothetical protein